MSKQVKAARKTVSMINEMRKAKEMLALQLAVLSDVATDMEDAELRGCANIDGYFIELSEHWTDILGWTVGELTERPFLHFVHPEDQERTRWTYEENIHGENILRFENRYRTKWGNYVHLIWYALKPENNIIQFIVRVKR